MELYKKTLVWFIFAFTQIIPFALIVATSYWVINFWMSLSAAWVFIDLLMAFVVTGIGFTVIAYLFVFMTTMCEAMIEGQKEKLKKKNEKD
jgi:hypothetical protein